MSKFIACLLGGWFGLHKFMEGKVGLGILYLLTGGLCGIGWIVDTIIYLVKWLGEPKQPAAVQTPVVAHGQERKRETVKVIDIDGKELDLSIYLCIGEDDKVLVAEGGKTYHTHLACYKHWKPEMIESFKGWKVIKKSEAISKGMKYCSFCKESDRYEECDFEDDYDEDEEY